MFDTYTLKARVYPIVILIFPFILIGLFYSLEFNSLLPLGSSALVSGAFSYLFSQLGRDRGKSKEPKLWLHWGGMPTIQILRWSDSTIDKYTKQRYHAKLLAICPVDIIPTASIESTASSEADEVYRTWTKFMISKTRDTKLYSLLFKDNCNYGFRRNLWGLKSIALWLISLLLFGNFLFGYHRTHSLNFFTFSNSVQYSLIGLLLFFVFWITIVSKKWIKVPAYGYAERLFEATETI